MKALLATAALAGVVMAATPTLAQTNNDGGGMVFAQAQTQRTRPAVHRRAAPVNPRLNSDGPVHSPNAANDVYDGPNYLGSDPDAFIRNELSRDQS